MTREELIKKFNQLKSAAELKHEQASKSLADGNVEDATNLRGEYQELMKEVKLYKGQIEDLDDISGLDVDNDPPATSNGDSKATRLPFNTDDVDDEPENDEPEPDSFNKSIYQARYGDINDATKAVARDVWGADYNEKRANQYRNFVKYVRFGESRMSHKERASLDELIYTPDVILREVKAGFTVDEIKANKADQQESILQMGGALVPDDVRMDIVQRLEGPTTVRGRATVVNTVRDSVEFPKLEGGDSQYISGIRVTWADAEIPADAEFAKTSFEVGTIKIPVDVVMARTDVSLNLLEDAGVDIVNFISTQFASALRIDENTQFLTGRGGGKPRGILGKGTLAEPAPDDGVGEVVSGESGALTADGLIDLSFEPDAQYLQDAVWLGTKSTFRDVRKLKDGNGDYLWQRGIERGAPPQLLGYDFLMDESMPDIGANAYPLVFGNLRAYYIVERVGATVQRVTDATLTGRNKAAIFLRRRVGGQVVMPWMLKVQKVAAS